MGNLWKNRKKKFRTACRHPPMAWRKVRVANRPDGRGDFRRFAFFPLSEPGQCWPRNSFSTPRKDARGVRFRYLFREVLKVLNQMRHKAAQTHFLPCIVFFRGAFLFSTRPTPDLAPEESKKEKSMLHSLLFYAPSPPSPKESRGRMKEDFL